MLSATMSTEPLRISGMRWSEVIALNSTRFGSPNIACAICRDRNFRSCPSAGAGFLEAAPHLFGGQSGFCREDLDCLAEHLGPVDHAQVGDRGFARPGAELRRETAVKAGRGH